jgi:hypothetical protein
MKQTVDALKALYVALGGDADDVADVTLTADMIDEITKIVSSKVLPSVTSSDNGKVLKVVDGEWDLGTDEITA